MATITSANSSLTLAVLKLFPVPQKIEGYAADDSFTVASQDVGEFVMGVDGRMSMGFVFNSVDMTITIMPDSPSLALFEAWINTEKATKDKFSANATVMMPSLGRKYVLTNGGLKTIKSMPDAKKLLQPMSFVITWQQVVGESL